MLVLCVKLFSACEFNCQYCYVAFAAVFLSVFSSVISVHSLSVCLLYFMLAALMAIKRIHNKRDRICQDATVAVKTLG